MGDLIGYARVSTDEQNLALQLDALKQAGCVASSATSAPGSLKHRPQLDACLEFLRRRRHARRLATGSSRPRAQTPDRAVEQLHQREIGFRSLTEQIDTTTSGGMLQFHFFGALAEFEREIIRERTRAGLAAATLRARTTPASKRRSSAGVRRSTTAMSAAKREAAPARPPERSGRSCPGLLELASVDGRVGPHKANTALN